MRQFTSYEKGGPKEGRELGTGLPKGFHGIHKTERETKSGEKKREKPG